MTARRGPRWAGKPYLRHIDRVENETFDRARFVRLDKNEGVVPAPRAILTAIRRRLTSGFLASYPQPWELERKLARYWRLRPGELYLTAGSDAAIKSAFEVFVEPGDEVVMAHPAYAMYGVYARLFRARPVPVPYGPRLELGAAELIRAITPRTALVIIANPNSPTGTVIPARELARVVRAAARRGVPVLVDEAYHPFSAVTMRPYLRRYPNLIITRTFSKAFALAAVRLGAVLADRAMIARFRTWRPVYEVNGFAVLAGTVLLDHAAAVRRTVAATIATRERFAARLRRAGIEVLPSSANFLNLRVGRQRVPGLRRHLRRHGILDRYHPAHPLLAECVRLSIGEPRTMARVARLVIGWWRKAGSAGR